MAEWIKTNIPIEDVIVEERIRKDLGDIQGLAKNIREIGLLNPITVRKVKDGYKLLAGHRRLQACKSLGWKEIPARILRAREIAEKEGLL